MSQPTNQFARLGPPARAVSRGGLTVVELLLSIAIMAMLAGVLGGLGRAVQLSAEYSEGHGVAAQHSRVALGRMSRAVREAYAVGEYPGAAVAWQDVAGWRFPDTLVVWRPTGAPANANGPPLVRELVIYCPDPTQPNVLLEITAPGDSRPVPLGDQLSTTWAGELAALKTSANSRRVVLTNLLRTASAGGASKADLRGCARFVADLRPSVTEMNAVKAGTLTWNQLVWPQGVYGVQSGLRHVWIRIELQLMPGTEAAAADPGGQQAIPFLGSAALDYVVRP